MGALGRRAELYRARAAFLNGLPVLLSDRLAVSPRRGQSARRRIGKHRGSRALYGTRSPLSGENDWRTQMDLAQFLRHIRGGLEQRNEDPVAECAHTVLTARWNSVEDIGIADRATSYVCAGCNQTFTAEEGKRIVAEQAAKMRNSE